MRNLIQFERLREDEPLLSPSGRYKLCYDGEGVAIVLDTHTGGAVWRAGEEGRPVAGDLLLGDRDAVQVEAPGELRTVWRSPIAAEGARSLILTDTGDLELLNGDGARIYTSRSGPVEPRPLRNSAPVAAITADTFLVRETAKWRRTVTREQDGPLRLSRHHKSSGLISYLPAPLVRWMEQEGTVLTWRMLPDDGRPGPRARTLCLEDSDGTVLWAEGSWEQGADLPPAEPHGHAGPELGAGGRLRNQSLTSASGAHTLTHRFDGNLVLYCDATLRVVWSAGTDWAGPGWTELTGDGELTVRNVWGAAVWSSGTAGAGGSRLVVRDDGRVALLDAGGTEVWAIDAHTSCAEAGPAVARGSVLRRGQTLLRRSLTSADGSTVLGHRDEHRLALIADDGTWIWWTYLGDAEGAALCLDEDGMLRIRGADGAVVREEAGPADELRVEPGEILLCRADGAVVWRNGEPVDEPEPAPAVPPSRDGSGGAGPELPEPETAPEEDFTAWLEPLTGDLTYCVTVIHDTAPGEALRRLGAEPGQITAGTWDELLTRGEAEDSGDDDLLVAAFALGPHTLLVEDNGRAGVVHAELSRGTFAVALYEAFSGATTFRVFRDGEVVADHSENGGAEPTIPEVRAALAAMGADDAQDAAFEDGLELLCRTAGVRPTVADVTGTALGAIIPMP
ncbi:DUF6461 domain-containing protein [Streptomyces zingiberis]|nr:DUF6461 domain-containing protein [Streptomyces zingiberis]